jgi:type III secretory pathway component EscU
MQDQDISQLSEIQLEKFDPVLNIKIDASMDLKELASVRSMIRSESSHGQWAKQGLCVLLLLCLIFMNLSMGSSSMDSIIGISKCDGAYWGIQVVFMAICIVCTVLAVYLARRDQRLKLKYGGINVSDSDIRYSDSKSLT